MSDYFDGQRNTIIQMKGLIGKMTKDTIKKYLGGKRFWQQTLMLAIPIALQNLLTSSFLLVDTLMVGQLGDVALSSVGMAGQWSWLLNIVVFGICSGSSVFVAQYWGIKDIKGIHKITGIALTLAMIITALFLCFGFFAPQTVVWLFNKTPEVIDTGSKYLKIACFSYPGSVLGLLLGAILRSVEDVKLPMYSALFTAVLNGILDYCLIFGALGLPALGVEGAALATCISAWLGPIVILGISVAKKNILYMPIKELFGFDRTLVLQFVKTASPVVLNETLWGLGTFLYNVIFANLGHENYAAVTILKTIENIAYVFFIGMCNACCVMLGKNVGAGKIKEAIKDSRRFGVLIPFLGLVDGMAILAFRGKIIGIFNMQGQITQTTINTAMIISLMYAIELPIRNIPYAFIVGIFRSGGDTINGAKMDLISLWLIALPLTFILAYVVKAPFVVVYAAMYVGEDYLKCFMCIKHYISYKWIKPVTAEGRKELEVFMAERNAKKNSEMCAAK